MLEGKMLLWEEQEDLEAGKVSHLHCHQQNPEAMPLNLSPRLPL